jgi:hypothetical protein
LGCIVNEMLKAELFQDLVLMQFIEFLFIYLFFHLELTIWPFLNRVIFTIRQDRQLPMSSVIRGPRISINLFFFRKQLLSYKININEVVIYISSIRSILSKKQNQRKMPHFLCYLRVSIYLNCALFLIVMLASQW